MACSAAVCRDEIAFPSVSEAAIGLVGVVAGVILAGVFEYTLRRRTEARESRAAARLLRDAFFLVIDSFRPTDAAPEVYDFHFALDEWREHRAVLARELTNREWEHSPPRRSFSPE